MMIFMFLAPMEGLFRGGNAAPLLYIVIFAHGKTLGKYQALRSQPLGEQRLPSSSCTYPAAGFVSRLMQGCFEER